MQYKAHFYVVCRNVERNSLRAKLVRRAEDWNFGSLYRWNQSSEPIPQILSPWPMPRLLNWNARVNEALTAQELKAVRTCVDRGQPFGDSHWVEKTVKKYNLLSVLRPIGHPQRTH